MADVWSSRRCVVDGNRTHYLEAGDLDAPAVVLLHYGGIGATVVECWEYTIGALADEYHVIAPETLGWGLSAKVVDFAEPLGLRIRNVARLLEILGVEHAHFLGVSSAGQTLMRVAATPQPAWPIDCIVGVSAVGDGPKAPEITDVLGGSDCSPEAMDRLLSLIYPRRWWDTAYLERRVLAAREMGAWEAFASERRVQPPFEKRTFPLSSDADIEYEHVSRPTLLVGGGSDRLRELGVCERTAGRIGDCRVQIYPGAGHYPHIECARGFNASLLAFLREQKV